MELLQRVSGFAHYLTGEHSSKYAGKDQVLSFFREIGRFPDGIALGIHGTTDVALSTILGQGLNADSSYYRLDPTLDPVLDRDLQQEDWQKILGRLERTLEHAAEWGETAFPKSVNSTAVIILWQSQEETKSSVLTRVICPNFPVTCTSFQERIQPGFIHEI